MRLETERLLLRFPELSDVPTIHVLAAHPDIARTTLNIPYPYPEDAAESFVQALIDSRETSPNVTLGMVRKTDGQFMGMISLRPEERFSRAEMGYWIGLPYWGQGYTSEAARRLVEYGFAELGLNRVYATYFLHNPASRRVMEKAGMTYEGTLRQHVRRDGVFYDLGYCGILRGEWEARRI